MTLAAESTPSTAIEAAANAKKFAAVAPCIDSHQPPAATNSSRAVCANTGPRTFAAPCEEKYIEIDSPMKAYIGAAVDRYCRLAARTPGSLVKISTQRSGKIAITVPTRPTDTNDTQPANSASMWVKIVTVSTDCSGEKQETAPTFRISKNMPRWIRRPLTIGVTRAR